MSGNLIHLDGTRIFQSRESIEAQREIAERLGPLWGCELKEFAELNPVDWFAVRSGRMVSVLELKRRYCTAQHYPTVFLQLEKWFHLRRMALGTGKPDFFVVQFSDEMRWIPIDEVDARRLSYRKAAGKWVNLIEVPISEMRRVRLAAVSND